MRENPQIADLVYADLTRGLKNPNTGCEGLSAEQVIRILIVKQVEQLSYRELPMDISDSITLGGFREFNDGEVPWYSSIATDADFYSKANAEYAKSIGIKDVVLDRGFGKLLSYFKSSWVYKKLKRFRAGIEATISWAKRCFGLDRCTWKGWNSFQSYVWSSIIAFNFTVIAYHLI